MADCSPFRLDAQARLLDLRGEGASVLVLMIAPYGWAMDGDRTNSRPWGFSNCSVHPRLLLVVVP
jgi:hypothetical protein